MAEQGLGKWDSNLSKDILKIEYTQNDRPKNGMALKSGHSPLSFCNDVSIGDAVAP